MTPQEAKAAALVLEEEAELIIAAAEAKENKWTADQTRIACKIGSTLRMRAAIIRAAAGTTR